MPEKRKMSLDEIRSLHGGYWRYDILDFHYLYNHYFPPKELIERLQEKLPKIIDNYPSTHKVIAKSLAKWKDDEWFNENNLVLGNGSSELIKVLNQIMPKVTVPIPIFNEYVQLPKERMNLFLVGEADKFKIDIGALIDSIEESKSEFVVLNNPNNPIGNVLAKSDIEKLLETGVKVVVDEAFIDFCRDLSVEDLVPKYKNLIVIYSCTKSMGFAGLRLGYMLTTNEEVKEKVKGLLPIWNINSIAEAFIEIFPDFRKDYENSIKKTLDDKKYLFEKLKEIPFLEPYESCTNFVFCKTSVSARKLAEILYGRYNILIKDGLNQASLKSDSYVRMGVKTKEDNDKLIEALKQIRENT